MGDRSRGCISRASPDGGEGEPGERNRRMTERAKGFGALFARLVGVGVVLDTGTKVWLVIRLDDGSR